MNVIGFRHRCNSGLNLYGSQEQRAFAMFGRREPIPWPPIDFSSVAAKNA